MAPAPRDVEAEVLKDSRWTFSGQRILWAGLDLGKVWKGRVMVLTSEM